MCRLNVKGSDIKSTAHNCKPDNPFNYILPDWIATSNRLIFVDAAYSMLVQDGKFIGWSHH